MNLICDNENIINIIKKEEKRILDFFNIDINKDITIKELDYDSFKKEYENYLECPLNNYVNGFIEDAYNTIVILNYKDWNKTIHKDESYENYEKVIVHEFVHIIHSIFCDKNYPSDELREGVAYYLANQMNNNYYKKFKEIIDNNSHEEVLVLLKGSVK